MHSPSPPKGSKLVIELPSRGPPPRCIGTFADPGTPVSSNPTCGDKIATAIRVGVNTKDDLRSQAAIQDDASCRDESNASPLPNAESHTPIRRELFPKQWPLSEQELGIFEDNSKLPLQTSINKRIGVSDDAVGSSQVVHRHARGQNFIDKASYREGSKSTPRFSTSQRPAELQKLIDDVLQSGEHSQSAYPLTPIRTPTSNRASAIEDVPGSNRNSFVQRSGDTLLPENETAEITAGSSPISQSWNGPYITPTKRAKEARKMTTKRMADALRLLASFSSVIRTRSEMSMFLEDHDLDDDKTLDSLEEVCSNIAALRRERLPQPAQADPANKQAEEADDYDSCIVFKDKMSITISIPRIRIELAKELNPRKTFGFLTRKGSTTVWRCALSGPTNVASQNDIILDSERMRAQVKDFAKHIRFRFPGAFYERRWGLDPGETRGSHVEPKLALAWAYRTLEVAFPNEPPSIEKLFELREVEIAKDAVIWLDDRPCKSCIRFLDKLRALTGIHFTWKVITKVGRLERVGSDGRRISNKSIKVGFEDDSEDDDDELGDYTRSQQSNAREHAASHYTFEKTVREKVTRESISREEFTEAAPENGRENSEQVRKEQPRVEIVTEEEQRKTKEGTREEVMEDQTMAEATNDDHSSDSEPDVALPDPAPVDTYTSTLKIREFRYIKRVSKITTSHSTSHSHPPDQSSSSYDRPSGILEYYQDVERKREKEKEERTLKRKRETMIPPTLSKQGDVEDEILG